MALTPIKYPKQKIILVLLSLLAVLWVQWPRLMDVFQVDRDFRSFYWMNKFQDPALFPPDVLQGSNSYISVEILDKQVILYFFSLGYELLFYLASFVVSPPVFSNILPFIILPITVLYLFEFGRICKDVNTGMGLALGFIILNLASSSSFTVLAGLQRSFTLPLMIVLIYYLHRQNYLAAAITVLISVLIYPPVAVLALGTWGLFVVGIRKNPWGLTVDKRGLGFLLVACVLAFIVLLPALYQWTIGFSIQEPMAIEQSAAASVETYQYMWDNPRLQSGGARPLFYFFPLVGRGGLVEDSEEVINFVILIAISGLIYLVLGRRSLTTLPRIIWSVLAAGLTLYVLAWLGILITNSFLLYVPNRYTRAALFIFFLMYIFLNGAEALKVAPDKLKQHPQAIKAIIIGAILLIVGLVIFYPSEFSTVNGFNMKWLLGTAGLVLLVLTPIILRKRSFVKPDLSKLSRTSAGKVLIGSTIILFLIGWGAYTRVTGTVGIVNPSPGERELLAFVKTLPKDALIAGTPCALDNIPLFAGRTILFGCFYDSEKGKPIGEALSAYYSNDKQKIIDFCRKYEIDYLVVDSEAYSSEYIQQGQMFFKPYNHQLLADIGDQNKFVLTEVSDEKKLFQAENYSVLSCDELD